MASADDIVYDDAAAASEFFAELFIDPNSLPDDGYGFFQLMFLLVVYGLIVIFASILMATGSELLVFIPEISGFVGSVIIPIIAQLIDAFIIIFSCLGANAQRELTIGVGALAGDTISLLTIGWFLATISGRVDLFQKTGMPNYFGDHKLSVANYWNFQGTGILIHKLTKIAASFMVLTSLSYVIILFPNIVYQSDSTKTIAFEDKNFALSAFVICLLMLGYYIYFQITNTRKEDSANNLLRDELLRDSIKKKIVSLLAVMTKDIENDAHAGLIEPMTDELIGDLASISREGSVSSTPKSLTRKNTEDSGTRNSPDAVGRETDSLIYESKAKKRLAILLRPFFEKYDVHKVGEMPLYNMHGLFLDIGELPPHHTVIDIFLKYEKNGQISYQNLVNGLFEFLSHHDEIVLAIAKGTSMAAQSESGDSNHERYKAELYEEISEFPTDILELSPADQRNAILTRGLIYILSGLFLALFFASPLIDVMDALGTRIGVSSFYISFVLSPVFADLYNFILIYRYASRRTSKSITLSLISLIGSIIINNTMVLAIFMILIYFQDLAWIFLSETAIIIVTELFIGLYCIKNVHTLLDGSIILLWYPLSIVIVYLWNTYGET